MARAPVLPAPIPLPASVPPVVRKNIAAAIMPLSLLNSIHDASRPESDGLPRAGDRVFDVGIPAVAPAARRAAAESRGPMTGEDGLRCSAAPTLATDLARDAPSAGSRSPHTLAVGCRGLVRRLYWPGDSAMVFSEPSGPGCVRTGRAAGSKCCLGHGGGSDTRGQTAALRAAAAASTRPWDEP